MLDVVSSPDPLGLGMRQMLDVDQIKWNGELMVYGIRLLVTSKK